MQLYGGPTLALHWEEHLNTSGCGPPKFFQLLDYLVFSGAIKELTYILIMLMVDSCLRSQSAIHLKIA